MDPTKLRTWLAAQIEAHAPDGTSREDKAIRLVDAAFALHGRPGKMAFGLQLPPEGVVDAEPLFARCLELLHAWEKVLEPPLRADLAGVIARLQDPGARPKAPTATHLLSVWTPAVAEDIETSELYGEPAILQPLDGVQLREKTDLLDLPCLRKASGGDVTRHSWGWAFAGEVRLRFDAARGKLGAELTFKLSREPSADELKAFLDVIRDELFFTNWGLNLEWDFDPEPETLHVAVRPEVERYELRALG